MANEIIPDEGLDYLLGLALKGTTQLANVYMGLFTSQTASTTPASTMVLATPSGITEATYTGYARVAIAQGDWGSAGAATIWSQATRALTSSQKSFPAATAANLSAPVNGFFLATASTAGVCLLASNFDDTTAVASLAIGDIIKVTPKFGLGG